MLLSCGIDGTGINNRSQQILRAGPSQSERRNGGIQVDRRHSLSSTSNDRHSVSIVKKNCCRGN